MQRRDFIALLGGVFSWPSLAHAQQKAMPVVGWLGYFSPPANPGELWVHQGLRELGFVEGQNIISEYRWADFHYERLPALAADLVNRKVDLILTTGGGGSALAAKNATSTIPIVFTMTTPPPRLRLERTGSTSPHCSASTTVRRTCTVVRPRRLRKSSRCTGWGLKGRYSHRRPQSSRR